VLEGERGKLVRMTREQNVTCDHKPFHRQYDQFREGCVEIAHIADIDDVEFASE
jgi:hypothetical protein